MALYVKPSGVKQVSVDLKCPNSCAKIYNSLNKVKCLHISCVNCPIFISPQCSVHRTAQAGFTQTHAQQPLSCMNAKIKTEPEPWSIYYRSLTIFFFIILSFMSFFIKDRSCTSCLNSDSSTVQIADACRTKCIKKKKKRKKIKREKAEVITTRNM